MQNVTTTENVLIAIVKLRVPANNAANRDPIGPALGQYGILTNDFISKFNEASKSYIDNVLMNVVLNYYSDFKYDFILLLPHLSFFIFRCINIEKGTRRPTRIIRIEENIPVIVPFLLYELACYLNNYHAKNFNLVEYSHYKSMVYSLKSMGIIYNQKKNI